MVKISKEFLQKLNKDYWQEFKHTHSSEEVAVEILKAHAGYTEPKDKLIRLLSQELGDKAEPVFQSLIKNGKIEMLNNETVSLPCVLSKDEEKEEVDESNE